MSLRMAVSCIGVAVLGFSTAAPAEGQAKKRDRGVDVAVEVVLTTGQRDAIRDFYDDAAPRGVASLPPGIRKNLARGKPLPPGIAKRQVPDGLRSRLTVADGYDVLEVGLDVLLVEVATGLIHDVLMDVVR